MAQVAQDTFVAELEDGSSLRVTRGSTWPDRHELVKRDGGRGHLFKPLDIDGADAPKSDADVAEAAPESEAAIPPPPDPPAAWPDAGTGADEAAASPDAVAEPVKAARARRPAAKGGA